MYIDDCVKGIDMIMHCEPRPEGYNPPGEKHLDPKWIARLGQTGKDCFDAIRRMDIGALGASLDETMLCREKLLPHVVKHPLIKPGLKTILKVYRKNHPGAMFSGCGGGHLLVVSRKPVPGAFQVTIRIAP
jgi:hypothetical protein